MRFKDTIGISHLVKGVENRLRNAIDGALSGLQLSLAQYSALSALEISRTLTNAELARECGVTPQTMNRLMVALSRARLVKKSNCAEHGLKINYELTPRAIDLLCQAHAAVNEIEKQSLQGLNAKDLKAAEAFLAKMHANLER